MGNLTEMVSHSDQMCKFTAGIHHSICAYDHLLSTRNPANIMINKLLSTISGQKGFYKSPMQKEYKKISWSWDSSL